MARITSNEQYKAISTRLEYLLLANSNEEPENRIQLAEMEILGNLIADYEEEHYPITSPSLPELLKDRMVEMGLTQATLAKRLKVSQARISEYLSGKREPTLKVARRIHDELHIDSDFILGVC